MIWRKHSDPLSRVFSNKMLSPPIPNTDLTSMTMQLIINEVFSTICTYYKQSNKLNLDIRYIRYTV